MLVVIMGMLIFSGLAYVGEKDEEGTMFISMPQVRNCHSIVFGLEFTRYLRLYKIGRAHV